MSIIKTVISKLPGLAAGLPGLLESVWFKVGAFVLYTAIVAGFSWHWHTVADKADALDAVVAQDKVNAAATKDGNLILGAGDAKLNSLDTTFDNLTEDWSKTRVIYKNTPCNNLDVNTRKLLRDANTAARSATSTGH